MFDREIFKKYIYPVAVISGSIIGVGFFSLPYIALRAGIWLTIFYLVALTALVIFIHRIYGEISIKTPDYKRLPGFAEFYLGPWGKAASMVSAVVGAFAVLLVYMLIGGGFLNALFSPIFGGSAFLYTLLYFLAGSVIIFFGIKIVARFEFCALSFLFLSFVIVFIAGFSKLKFQNIFLPFGEPSFNVSNLFLPFGPILFSLWGTTLIPEAEEMLGRRKRHLKKIITAGIIIPAVVYLIFIFLMLGIMGKGVTESALTGLRSFLDSRAFSLIVFAGFLATFNGFIALGLTLKKTLVYDFSVKKWHAFIITCFVPLVLFLLGIKSFIPLISFAGGFLLAIEGILILLMYKKIGGRKIIIYPLLLFFLLSVLYQLAQIFII